MNFRAIVSFALAGVCFAANETMYTVDIKVTGAPGTLWLNGDIRPQSWGLPHDESAPGMFSYTVAGGSSYAFKLFQDETYDNAEGGWWNRVYGENSCEKDTNRYTPVINSNTTIEFKYGECPYSGDWDGVTMYDVTFEIADRGMDDIYLASVLNDYQVGQAEYKLPLTIPLFAGIAWPYKFVNTTSGENVWESESQLAGCLDGSGLNRFIRATKDVELMFDGFESCTFTSTDVTTEEVMTTEPPMTTTTGGSDNSTNETTTKAAPKATSTSGAPELAASWAVFAVIVANLV